MKLTRILACTKMTTDQHQETLKHTKWVLSFLKCGYIQVKILLIIYNIFDILCMRLEGSSLKNTSGLTGSILKLL
jgi:hypothetical protein